MKNIIKNNIRKKPLSIKIPLETTLVVKVKHTHSWHVTNLYTVDTKVGACITNSRACQNNDTLILTCLEYVSGQCLHEGSGPGRRVGLPTLSLQSKCQFKSKPTWTFVSIAPKVVAEK